MNATDHGYSDIIRSLDTIALDLIYFYKILRKYVYCSRIFQKININCEKSQAFAYVHASAVYLSFLTNRCYRRIAKFSINQFSSAVNFFDEWYVPLNQHDTDI